MGICNYAFILYICNYALDIDKLHFQVQELPNSLISLLKLTLPDADKRLRTFKPLEITLISMIMGCRNYIMNSSIVEDQGIIHFYRQRVSYAKDSHLPYLRLD